MTEDGFVHLPELYMSYESLKKLIDSLGPAYKKLKKKKMAKKSSKSELKKHVTELIEKSFFETEFFKTNFPDFRSYSMGFTEDYPASTNTNKEEQEFIVTTIPSTDQFAEDIYYNKEKYIDHLSSGSKWALDNGLILKSIETELNSGPEGSGVTFVFGIPQHFTIENELSLSGTSKAIIMTEKISDRLNKIRKHLNGMDKMTMDDVVIKELESVKKSLEKIEADIDIMVNEEAASKKSPEELESLYKKGEKVFYKPILSGFNPATELVVAAVNYTEGESDVPFPTKPGFYYTFEGTALRAHESDITNDPEKAKDGADIRQEILHEANLIQDWKGIYQYQKGKTGFYINTDSIQKTVPSGKELGYQVYALGQLGYFHVGYVLPEELTKYFELTGKTEIRNWKKAEDGIDIKPVHYFKDGGEIEFIPAKEFKGDKYFTIGPDDGNKPLYNLEEVDLIKSGYRIELELRAERYTKDQIVEHLNSISKKFKYAAMVPSDNEFGAYWRIYVTNDKKTPIVNPSNLGTKNKQGYSCSLLNRKEKVIDTMNVSFKDDDYAKDAFKATGIAVKPTDYIRWN